MKPTLALLGSFLALAARGTPRASDLPSFDVAAAQRRAPAFGMTAEVDPAWQAWAGGVLGRAMSRYPRASLGARLDAVYVVRLLWWDKAYYGGTSTVDHRALVLSVGSPGVDAPWLERSFHHELAHVLQFTAGGRFPRKEWISANAPGFRYGYADASGAYHATQGTRPSEAFDPGLNEQGILHGYAATTFEEDWTCYAAFVLSNDAGFWALAARYPRIAAKARMVVGFYERAFPGIRLHAAPTLAASRFQSQRPCAPLAGIGWANSSRTSMRQAKRPAA